MTLRTTAHMILRHLLLLVVLVGLTGNPVFAEPTRQQNTNCDGKIFPNYETAYAYYLRGNGCAEEGRYERAIEDYVRAIALEPGYSQAYAQRGRAYFEQGDYERAAADYEEYKRLTGEMEPFMVEQIDRMESPPDVEETETPVVVCNQVLDPKTDTVQNFFDRALVCFKVGKFDQAVDDLLTAVELDADYYTVALDHFTEVIDTKPTDAEAYIIRGRIYVMSHEFDLASADFDQALELDPESARAYMGHGSAYVLQKENQKAITALSQAIAIDPEYVLAYRTRGGVYGRLDNYDLAFKDMNRALELSPEDGDLYAMRAALYLTRAGDDHNKTDCNKALDDAEQVLALAITDDDRATGYQARGLTYICLEDTSKAIADFRQFERITGYLTPAMQKMIAMVQKPSSPSSSISIKPTPPPRTFNPFPILIAMGIGWAIQQLRKK